MARNPYTGGLVLLGVGLLILLGKLGVIGMLFAWFWPAFILLLGLAFHYFFFAGTAPAGVLVPGGMLIVYALLFFVCAWFGWHLMGALWPGFILGAAAGLYEWHFFSARKPPGVMFAALILTALSVIFFSFSILFSAGVYLLAIALIVVGALLLLQKSRVTW
ncbi:MAG TPA: hypothetical protein VF260_07175 [Bacilli bacterium]